MLFAQKSTSQISTFTVPFQVQQLFPSDCHHHVCHQQFWIYFLTEHLLSTTISIVLLKKNDSNGTLYLTTFILPLIVQLLLPRLYLSSIIVLFNAIISLVASSTMLKLIKQNLILFNSQFSFKECLQRFIGKLECLTTWCLFVK